LSCLVSLAVGAVYRPMPEEDNAWFTWPREEQRTFISFLILQRSMA